MWTDIQPFTQSEVLDFSSELRHRRPVHHGEKPVKCFTLFWNDLANAKDKRIYSTVGLHSCCDLKLMQMERFRSQFRLVKMPSKCLFFWSTLPSITAKELCFFHLLLVYKHCQTVSSQRIAVSGRSFCWRSFLLIRRGVHYFGSGYWQEADTGGWRLLVLSVFCRQITVYSPICSMIGFFAEWFVSSVLLAFRRCTLEGSCVDPGNHMSASNSQIALHDCLAKEKNKNRGHCVLRGTKIALRSCWQLTSAKFLLLSEQNSSLLVGKHPGGLQLIQLNRSYSRHPGHEHELLENWWNIVFLTKLRDFEEDVEVSAWGSLAGIQVYMELTTVHMPPRSLCSLHHGYFMPVAIKQEISSCDIKITE